MTDHAFDPVKDRPSRSRNLVRLDGVVPTRTGYRFALENAVAGVALAGKVRVRATYDGISWETIRTCSVASQGKDKEGNPRTLAAWIEGQFAVVSDGRGSSFIKRPLDLECEFEPLDDCNISLDLSSIEKPVSLPSTRARSPAFVQSTGIQTGSQVVDDSASVGTVTAGNFLAVGVSGWHDTGYTNNDCTDDLSNAYNLAGAEQRHYNDGTQNESGVSLWYAEDVNGGACTVTVDPTAASNNDLAWAAAEFSGIETVASIDQTAQNTAANTATDANVTTGATTQADELVLAVAQVSISGDADVAWGAAATTSYTNIAQYPDFTTINSISFDFKVVAVAEAQSANWSHDPCNGLAKNSWGCVVATFKSAIAPIENSPETIRTVRPIAGW